MGASVVRTALSDSLEPRFVQAIATADDRPFPSLRHWPSKLKYQREVEKYGELRRKLRGKLLLSEHGAASAAAEGGHHTRLFVGKGVRGAY